MYHPIWEAAAEHDLTLQLHLGGEGIGVHPPMTSAGFPTHYIERRMAEPGLYLPHLASFIFEGGLRQVPEPEAGPGRIRIHRACRTFSGRMDACWKGLRHQVPWIKELPSEIFYRHVWVTTQPMYEYNEDHANLMKMVEWLRGDQRFVYASDYPHWDWDDPNDAARTFPSEMRERVFSQNAHEAYPATAVSTRGRRAHVVCRADELGPGQRVIADCGAVEVGVFNLDGEYFALLKTAAPTNRRRSARGSTAAI